MAKKSVLISSTITTGTGNKDFTSSGFGTVGGCIIETLSVGSLGTDTSQCTRTLCFFDGTTTRSIASASEHNQATTDTESNIRTDFYTVSGAGAPVHIGTLSTITDGVRLNLSTNAAGAAVRVVVRLLSSDLDLQVGDIDTDDASYTGASFTPDFGIFASHVRSNTANDSAHSAVYQIGLAVNDGSETQYSSFQSSAAFQGAEDVNSAFRNDCIAMEAVTTGFLSLDSWTSTGFTCSTTGSATQRRLAFMLVGGVADVDLRTITIPTAAGLPKDQSITGLGFQPTALFGLFTNFSGTVNTASTVIDQLQTFSNADETSEYSTSVFAEDAADPTVTARRHSAEFLETYQTADAADELTAALKQYDSGGYTFTWSQIGSNLASTANQVVLAVLWEVGVTTGTGTPQASTATASGTGVLIRTGTGSPQAATATAAGAGTKIITASGAPQAATATTAGVGVRISIGTAAVQAATATAVGTADRVILAAGAVQADIATVAATGIRGPTGTAAVQASTALSSATGVVIHTATAAVQATTATTVGTGVRTVVASGSPQAATATTSGTGVRIVVGTAAVQAATATTSGTGVVGAVILASGAPQATTATTSATGVLTRVGTAAVQAETATAAGTGTLIHVGTAAVQAATTAVSGVGVRISVATGAPQAATATVVGTGTIAGQITASGAVQASTATAAGVGVLIHTGTGAVQAATATAAGAGVLIHVATGAVQASTATAAGVGVLIHTGTGAVQAATATAAGAGVLIHVATGAVQASTATAAGVGVLIHTGTGAVQAATATAAGAGVLIHVATGAVQASTAVAAGTGTVTSATTGTGAVQASTATVSATGGVIHVGTAAVQAATATSSGAGTVGEIDITGTGAVQASTATTVGKLVSDTEKNIAGTYQHVSAATLITDPTLNFTVADFGEVAGAIVIMSKGVSGLNTDTADATRSITFWDGTNTQSLAQSLQDNVGTTYCKNLESTTAACLIIPGQLTSTRVEGTISLTTNGVSVAINTIGSDGFFTFGVDISVILLKNLECKVDTFDSGNNYAGATFKPEVGLFWGSTDQGDDDDYWYTFGLAAGAAPVQHYYHGFSGGSRASTSSIRQQARDEAIGQDLGADYVRIDEWTATGFNSSEDVGTTNHTYGFMLLRGGSAFDLLSSLNKYTYPAVTGTDAVTGIGFAADLLLGTFSGLPAWNSSSSTYDLVHTLSVKTSEIELSFAHFEEDGLSTTDNGSRVSNKFGTNYQSSANADPSQQSAIDGSVSITADGHTFDWTSIDTSLPGYDVNFFLSLGTFWHEKNKTATGAVQASTATTDATAHNQNVRGSGAVQASTATALGGLVLDSEKNFVGVHQHITSVVLVSDPTITFTVPNFGAPDGAIIVMSMADSVINTDIPDISRSVTFWDGTNTRSQAQSSSDNRSVTDTYSYFSSSFAALLVPDEAATIRVEGDISLTTDGISVDFTAVGSDGLFTYDVDVAVILIKNLECQVGHVTGGSNYAGSSFRPQLGLFTSNVDNFGGTSDYRFTLGVATQDLTQYTYYGFSEDGFSTSSIKQVVRDNAVAENLPGDYVWVDGWTDTGFTVSELTGSSNHTNSFMLLKGSGAFDLLSDLRKYTYPAVTGTDAVTGVGFAADVLLGLFTGLTTWNSTSTSYNLVNTIGLKTSEIEYAFAHYEEDSRGDTDLGTRVSNKFATNYQSQLDVAVSQQAQIDGSITIDADGHTFDWTSIGTSLPGLDVNFLLSLGTFWHEKNKTASGAVQAATATAVGAAHNKNIRGSGAVQASTAIVASTGVLVHTGISAAQATTATATGAGQKIITGTGAVQAETATVVGVGFVAALFGSGDVQASTATVSATGTVVTIFSTGAVQAEPATASGTASLIRPASGAVQADAATVSGTGVLIHVGTGAVQASPATVVGIGFKGTADEQAALVPTAAFTGTAEAPTVSVSEDTNAQVPGTNFVGQAVAPTVNVSTSLTECEVPTATFTGTAEAPVVVVNAAGDADALVPTAAFTGTAVAPTVTVQRAKRGQWIF